MNLRRTKPFVALLAVTLIIVVALETPAMAHQVRVAAHKISGSSLKNNSVTGVQVKESTLGNVPSATIAKHIAPAVLHPLALINGWTSDTDLGRTAAYSIDAQGYVHLEGVITSSQLNDLPFRLPAAARPSEDVSEPVVEALGYLGEIVIKHSGEVDIFDPVGGPPGDSKVSTSLEGVTYSVE